MRVVIADDEKFVLVVLKSALRSVRFPIEIVGEALDGDDAYRLCCKKKPDLLITDICMPRKDGLDLLAKLRETQPELPVIIYSGFDNFSYARKPSTTAWRNICSSPLTRKSWSARSLM